MRRAVKHGIAWMLLAVSAWGTRPACAQSLLPARVDVAGGRVQPDSQPEGIILGNWTLLPQLTTKVGFDSNVYGTETGQVFDEFAILSPALEAKGKLGTGSIQLSGSANAIRYFSNTNQDLEEYSLRAGVQYPLGRFTLSANVGANRAADRYGYTGTPLSTGTPSVHGDVGENVEIRHDSGPVQVSLSASHQSISYSDILDLQGRPISQRFRDSTQWLLRGQATYAPSDNAAAGAYLDYQPSTVPFPNNYSNNTLEGGGLFSIDTGMFRLEAKAGYMRRNFSNPAFQDFHGPVYNATLSWYPTPLLSLSVTLNRILVNSGVPTVGAIVTTNRQFHASYELLRKLVFEGIANFQHNDFPEIDGTVDTRMQQIKGEYSFNRFVAIGLYARHLCNVSSVASTAPRFCVSVTALTVSVRH